MNIAIETVYAELTERCHAAAGLEGVPENAAAQWRDRGGRAYLYFKWRDGNRFAERYAGPENDHTKALAAGHQRRRDDRAERRDMVRMLAGARMPQLDARTGKVLAALADAGVFRLRGVLVGTVAFQVYAPMIGMPLRGAALRTQDVDIAQDYGVSVALDDALTRPPLEILRDVDPGARAIPARSDGRLSTTYEAAGVRVEFLTTNRGADRDAPSRLPALRTEAQGLRMMDFLLRDVVPAALLHDAGVAVNVPAPARFAVHKLMVSQRRMGGKAGKDLAQAEALVRLLSDRQPLLLQEVLLEAHANGPSWRAPLEAAIRLLPAEVQKILQLDASNTEATE